MAPPKGTSNNPAGRPPKARALTAILERALAETRAVPEQERKVAAKTLLAQGVVNAVLTGELPYTLTVETATGGLVSVKAQLPPKEWRALVAWVYTHIDGPPARQLDVTSDGQAVPVVIIEVVPPAAGHD